MKTALTSVAVHASTAAALNLGAAGATIQGVLSSLAYNQEIGRTVLLGPMYAADAELSQRLFAPENGLAVQYSSLHHKFDGVNAETRAAFQEVERRFQVAILYGRRPFGAFNHEVLLVDASNPDRELMARFKDQLREQMGIDCQRHFSIPEFNLHMATAAPLWAAAQALGVGAHLPRSERLFIAHDWPGMTTLFACQMSNPGEWRAIYFAHETPTARHLVENHPGHDTRFYNALFKAREWRLNLESVFGSQDHLHFHAIVRQATLCETILAAGDLVRDELRFLGGGLANASIAVAYAGLSPAVTEFEAKKESKRLLQEYSHNLIGFAPDFVFTHVAELTLADGLWRDLRVLEHLDSMLQQTGERAVLFILGSSTPLGKHLDQIVAWEERYGWPVMHRGDNGDLEGIEERLYFDGIEPLNRRAASIQVVLVNQFGWSQERCGRRMPAEMEFLDIRRGSDLEFGQSIYAPCGVATLQPTTYGALACMSNVCGCVGMVSEQSGGVERATNLVVADYCTLPSGFWLGSPYDALAIDQGVRDWIEGVNSRRAAQTIFQRLPRSDEDVRSLMASGGRAAERMSWEAVVSNYFLPVLRRTEL